MAVTYMTGCEIASAGMDYIVLSGASAYSTTQARTGSRSIRCNPASSVNGYFSVPSMLERISFGLYVASLPSVARVIAGESTTGYGNLRLGSDGLISVYSGSTLRGTSSTALTTGRWYWIGWKQSTISGSEVHLQIDGVDEVTASGYNDYWATTLGCASGEASAIDLYIDDVIGSESTGGFLAPSKVALLLPISDNHRIGWTNGTGGLTNLYDAVNNIPPAGLATETATSQIEHPGGSAGTTDDYTAAMTTYETAGIGSSDTIIALKGMVIWGEDSATGTKLCSYSGVANPSWTGESSIDVSSGHGTGATLNYGAGPPDYWNERWSAIKTTGLAIGSDITLDTSPTMQVVRPETASRVASVCFMGMYVVWTPYVAPPVSIAFPRKVYPQLLSH